MPDEEFLMIKAPRRWVEYRAKQDYAAGQRETINDICREALAEHRRQQREKELQGWHAEKWPGNTDDWGVMDGDGGVLVDACTKREAQLIAAAPELLEAWAQASAYQRAVRGPGERDAAIALANSLDSARTKLGDLAEEE